MLFRNVSESSRGILVTAANEARMMGHFYIGTEHVFNGMCSTSDEDVQWIFQEMKIDPLIRREVRKRVGTGRSHGQGDDIILTPRVHEIAKKTDEIAKTYQMPEVEPSHIFLALLRGGDGVAVRMLKGKGVDIDYVQSILEERIEKASDEMKINPLSRNTPFLNKIGRDLSMLARQGKISPVIGRRDEIKRIAQILTMKKKNSSIIVGEAGVGKTAVVEGLALKLAQDDAPEELRKLRIIEISMTSLVAGTRYRGDFEQRALTMIEEAASNRDVVLFIDEIHTMMGAGDSGGMDASNILKPPLARGEIRCIGATTVGEYRKYIEKDAAFERRFQTVYIDEPSKEETVKIISGLKESYEAHHGIKVTENAVQAAVYLSHRYLPNRRLPDKAIDLIDHASAKKKLKTITFRQEDFEKAGFAEEMEDTVEITDEDIAHAVTDWTGIPVHKLAVGERERFLKMEDVLARRVIGQDSAVRSVSNIIRMVKTGLADPKRPAGVFLFTGPTGTGKTELAKALAEFLFGDENKIIRIDMSEYMEQHNVSRLIGAPPGYVGHGSEGQLTGLVRTHPYSVVLLDEIEKAHPDVCNLFLQVFDEGRLTDSEGRHADFTNTVIIMTSNISNPAVRKKAAIGFNKNAVEDSGDETYRGDGEVKEILQNIFRPEFINRIDRIIQFNPLGKEDVRLIIDKLLDNIKARLSQKKMTLHINDEVYEYIIDKGYNRSYGVREMERVIQQFLVEPLANEIMNDRFQANDGIHIKVVSDNIIFMAQDKFNT